MLSLRNISFEELNLPTCFAKEFDKKVELKNNRYIAIGHTDNKALYSYHINEVNNIPFMQYYCLFNLINALETSQKVEEIISYGSLASTRFSKNSDIDLFLVSPFSTIELHEIIENIFDITFILNSSIKIIHEDLLIECEHIQNIDETVKYLPESPYVEEHKRIFLAKNFDETKHRLENIARRKIDIERRIDELKLQLYYTVFKLPKYKNDYFRLRFHAQIIEHAIVRLRAIKQNNSAHNYSPRNAIESLSKSEWAIVAFDIFDDAEDYIKRINSFSREIIDEMGGLSFLPYFAI